MEMNGISDLLDLCCKPRLTWERIKKNRHQICKSHNHNAFIYLSLCPRVFAILMNYALAKGGLMNSRDPSYQARNHLIMDP